MTIENSQTDTAYCPCRHSLVYRQLRSIPSVSVKDRTEIDQTGNPLYPLPK